MVEDMEQLQRYALSHLPELVQQGPEGVRFALQSLLAAQSALADEQRGPALMYYATPALEVIEYLIQLLRSEARKSGYTLPLLDVPNE